MTTLILHGWGKNKEDYKELLSLIPGSVAIDLPGFGKESLPCVFDLDDYVDFVVSVLKKAKMKNVALVGHSFGGRVAIKLASTKPELINKLILVDSGGIQEITLKMKIASKLPRFGSLGRGLFGSKDYLSASGDLRETMKNVVNEDLTPFLSKINIPTLILWGDRDNTTPIWMGRLMHEKIKGSNFVDIKDGDHGIPYRKAKEVALEINKFI